ncbi:MAG: putative sodium:thiamine symporter ThiV [Phormidesmis priestleyi Ana]|uniref:Putative sodium:thiamine symporter ThiV n=1 Tax=Phormidesmis priestleyi Ana TaxID=1666911 RepID=A0A0P8BTK0_9CYAN|nr:MAG: putative sodium:thiamine symporter ThiV [Phormidesmis priestleyi Ana]
MSSLRSVSDRDAERLEDYMVSRNQIGGSVALATITASALGAWILFSPAEAGSTFGGLTAILGYCLGSATAVFLFVFVGPRLRQIMPWGHSLNEYVRHRFSQGAFAVPIYWLTVGVMLLYMFVYLAAELTAIAQAIQLIVPTVPLYVPSIAVITVVFIYTAYGGLKATILTDALQFALIVPLLLICFGATVGLMGGFSAAFAPVANNMPELLSFANVGGLRFGATLVIAIVSAELFNQGNWQRVYACRNDQTVRRSFLGSALVILPMITIAGLLGLMAVGRDISGPTAFFELLQSLAIPGWLLWAVIGLALALVMSSLDTMLNGISSVFTADLLKLTNQPDKVLQISRWLTVAVGIPAIAIASQGYSVLYLFFIADLLCAALIFPIVFSLYNRYQTASSAFWSSVIGLATGAIFFPTPDFAPLVNIPGGGDLLNSFATALVTSTLVTLGWSAISKSSSVIPFNYRDLQQVKRYEVTVLPSQAERP